MPKSTTTKLQAWRVVIAEDDDEFRKVLAQSFRDLGFSVTECRHGVDLIGQLRCLKDPAQPSDFDLIISDIRMPGVTGLSVLEGLREFKNVPPTILITAFGDEQTHSEAKRLGAAAMIDKPFEIADLLSKSEEILTAKAT
jgi:CheY-like chemotaxis protein